MYVKIKKTSDGNYVIYNESDFDNYHTHTPHLRVAKKIRSDINAWRLPRTDNIRLLESYRRVATDKIYIQRIDEMIEELENLKGVKNKKWQK